MFFAVFFEEITIFGKNTCNKSCSNTKKEEFCQQNFPAWCGRCGKLARTGRTKRGNGTYVIFHSYRHLYIISMNFCITEGSYYISIALCNGKGSKIPKKICSRGLCMAPLGNSNSSNDNVV